MFCSSYCFVVLCRIVGPAEEQKELQRLRDEVKKAERKRDKQQRKRKMAASLSFALEEDEEEQEDGGGAEEPAKLKKVAKNPDVDTSHLPDRGRRKGTCVLKIE